MKNKNEMIPEIVIPKGYEMDEVLDTSDDFVGEKPIYSEEVKIKFE